jgi:hypothetical protein
MVISRGNPFTKETAAMRPSHTVDTSVVRTQNSITVRAGVHQETPTYPAHLLLALDQVLGTTG